MSHSEVLKSEVPFFDDGSQSRLHRRMSGWFLFQSFHPVDGGNASRSGHLINDVIFRPRVQLEDT